MGTSADTVAFFLEQLEGRGVTTRKMFGDYAVHLDGKTVALICDDVLFVRILPETAAYLQTPVEGLPYPGAKPQYRIAADRWEDADWLWGLLRLLAEVLPEPKPKPSKPKGEPRAPRKKH